MKKYVDFSRVSLEDGFWKKRYDLNKDVSVHAVYERFNETGRIDALLFRFDEKAELHIYYDSDTAKWIEAVSYLIINGEKYPKYEKIIDAVADALEKNNIDGYIDSYFIQREPNNIYKIRTAHELYCLGHMIEAAIAYDRATGKNKLLTVCENAVDHAIRAFVTEKTAAFKTCGHEEIELALIKLYRYTKEKKYLDFAMFFLNARGVEKEEGYDFARPEYDQRNKPVRELQAAEGHAVRAVYLYIAMADAAAETGDKELMLAAERLFDSITEKRMYVTGGIGSECLGENFTCDYDLPNLHAYSESCAAIGLALFALTMQQSHDNAKYADVIERVLYNSMLSSTSLDGKSFFYENPLEITLAEKHKDNTLKNPPHLPIAHRKEVFDCSCCPPNINRIFARIADFIYSEDGDNLYVWQYMHSRFGDANKSAVMETDFPISGKIEIRSKGYGKIFVRKPSWCDGIKANRGYAEENGCLVFDGGEDIKIDFGMPICFVEANPGVWEDGGKVALARGPVVYCLEGVDNPSPLWALSVNTNAAPTEKYTDFCSLPILEMPARKDKPFAELYRKAEHKTESVTLKFIPYYTFANREECDMRVFIRRA